MVNAVEESEAGSLRDSQQIYGTTILLEQRARRLAEEDALRLYNRVRQLQKEEGKAHKRIQETTKKAREIVRLRERNEQAQLTKEQRLQELQAEIERQRAENRRLAEEVVRNRTEHEERLWAEKVALAEQTREERVEMERQRADERTLSRKEALEQRDMVRRAEEEARLKLEQLRLAKLHLAQDDYERRLKKEMDEKQAREAEIERLAEVEMQLIERLKEKQMRQRKAYQQLEAVLALGSSGTRRSTSKASLQVDQQPLVSDEPTEEEIARSFSMYDQGATGEIPTSALDNLMRDLRVALTPTQLSQAIGQLDTAGVGRVSFGEFLVWWKG